VTGRLLVKLWASSSVVDTDFTAKLVDVYPPSADFPAGIALNVEDSIVRSRYRDSLEKATLMTPGKIYAFTIEMYPASLVFARGHRIRLDISSSNFPRFDVNPNTGEPLNDDRRWAIGERRLSRPPAPHPDRAADHRERHRECSVQGALGVSSWRVSSASILMRREPCASRSCLPVARRSAAHGGVTALGPARQEGRLLCR
jgi:predicted acyl esterase